MTNKDLQNLLKQFPDHLEIEMYGDSKYAGWFGGSIIEFDHDFEEPNKLCIVGKENNE